MAQYEIEAEDDDPRDFVFKKKCICCKKPADIQFAIEEESKIRDMLSNPWLMIIILFIIVAIILELLIPQYYTYGLAVLLSTNIWIMIRKLLKKSFNNLFRSATAYICPVCSKKLEKVNYVGAIYGCIIFLALVVWAIWGFIYEPKSVPLFIVGISILGIFFGGAIVGFLENLFIGYLDLKTPKLSLVKQGLFRGTTKLTMNEIDYKDLVEDDEPINSEESL